MKITLGCDGGLITDCLSCLAGNYLNFNDPISGRGTTGDGTCVALSAK